MRILNIIAQKPYATGSGIYLVETMKEFAKLGHENASVFACYENETFDFGDKNKEYKVVFNTNEMPFNIFGMSDTMPYENKKYSEMTDANFDTWKNGFLKVIDRAILEFKPDVLICHHLYLLTSIVREKYKGLKIYGICHNTDLRQFIKTDFKREYLKENISKLDKIFAPTEYHKKLLCELYDVDVGKTNVIGIGYNKDIFYNKEYIRDKNTIRFLYVGKVAKKKGLNVLISAFKNIKNSNVELNIVGGTGNKLEYDDIVNSAKNLYIKVNFLGKKTQCELSDIYNNSDYLIMPTLFDAVPLTMIEALACGCKVIISDLPGLKDYVDDNVKNAYVKYVEMPKMYNADETTSGEIFKFANRLSSIIQKEIKNGPIVNSRANLDQISWENVVNKILI